MHALWLAIWLPRLPLEALSPPLESSPCAVVERAGGRRILCSNASERGVRRGMPLSAATALVPTLWVRSRRPSAERRALRVLAAAAYRYSSYVTVQVTAPAADVPIVWSEIGASLRLFGGLEPLLARLTDCLVRLGYTHRIGVAPTPEGAALLALAGLPPVIEPGAFRTAAEGLPLRRLSLPEEVKRALEGSGLRRVGEVLRLPRAELAHRFGQSIPDYLGRLTGRLPDPHRAFRMPRRYRRDLELEAEVESLEGLQFPLRRLLVELQEYLAARDTGVQAFRATLVHADTSSPIDIRLSAPSRDAAHLLMLARDRLERASLPAPVRALRLAADRFLTPAARQHELFPAPGDTEWEAVLDRLRARLGEDAVHGLGLVADHRPEKSWQRLPPGARGESTAAPARPLWLLPAPRPLSGAPRCVSGPERIEGGWWDGADVARDYYLARTQDGACLWVYRDHRSGGWFLQGLWS